MRGERSGRRNPDPEVKAAALGADQNKSDGPGTLTALGEKISVWRAPRAMRGLTEASSRARSTDKCRLTKPLC